MDKKKFAALITLLCFILILCGFILYNSYVSLDVQQLEIQFEVSDRMGFNVDTEALYFGKNYPGGVSRRETVLKNNYGFPVYISAKITGNVSGFVSVSDNNFILMPDETKSLTFYLKTGKETPRGEYMGEAKMCFYRAFFRLLRYLTYCGIRIIFL